MKTITSLATLLLVCAVLEGCTPKMNFVNSTIAPAATGTINVKKDKNKNYKVTVNVSNLAESNKLTPAKATYLVWMEGDDNSVKKLGQIAPRGKALRGELITTAISKPKEVFVTAEDNPEIAYPAGDVILTTRK
ncbi:hypothetical protein [Spirosoma fluviale]|uniref:Anti-sigma-K factor rskA n=1 Tax=Spirosoma fluviale TaxID=1597977 RepID=A0A286GBC4_9BACT|nr:hypothetical protein [Spirosoma fluviale]SOD92817.1 hypothetical protein SAMN06269250_4194 [Spirosoma fluviale]